MILKKLIYRMPGDPGLTCVRLLCITLLSFGMALIVILVIAWLDDEKSVS
jgi:phage shock protein PspC (stress-responsive transcriptional regulator)